MGIWGGGLIPAENHIGGKSSSTTHIDGIDSKLQRSNSTTKKHFKALSFLSFIYENNSMSFLQFELQWMLIHCDPKRAQRESCNELPPSEVQ